MVGLFTGDDGAGLMSVLCFYTYRELSIPIGSGYLIASVLLAASYANLKIKTRSALYSCPRTKR